MTARRPFFSDCVSWCRKADLEALEWLQDAAEEIDLPTLRALVDPEDMRDLEDRLGYALDGAPGIRLDEDYHVAFRREPSTGIPFIEHSHIEYVFATPDEIAALEEALAAAREAECGAPCPT